ncbi:MAG: EboA domain-containing protein [Polyangiales bacterium]
MSAAQETDRARALLAVVEARAKPEVWEWLLGGVPAGGPLQRAAFFGRYAGAGRRLAAPQPVLTAAERAGLLAIGVEVPEVFSLGDLARAALLCQGLATSEPGEHVALLTELFRKGDNAERIALLRALPLLPVPERFVALAVEACRTHVLDVFASIACENPFPARHFPDPSFNQLVMKTLFQGLALDRVHGWRGRCNPALRASAADYEAERRAAGRQVPADVVSIRATEGPPP